MKKLSLDKYKNEIGEKIAVRSRQKKRFEAKKPKYMTLLWEVYDRLDVTIHEYILADSIHKLSSSASPVAGWCVASKEYLGSVLRVSERSIFNLITNLQKKGLIETQPETGYLKTTKKWIETVELEKDTLFGKSKD